MTMFPRITISPSSAPSKRVSTRGAFTSRGVPSGWSLTTRMSSAVRNAAPSLALSSNVLGKYVRAIGPTSVSKAHSSHASVPYVSVRP